MVRFEAQPGSEPRIVVDHPGKGIEGVQIVFAGVTNEPVDQVVRFDEPITEVPFGNIKHLDLTYLPGVVTLELFSHEVELLPRTLFLNRREKGWQSGDVIRLGPWNRPVALPEPIPGRSTSGLNRGGSSSDIQISSSPSAQFRTPTAIFWPSGESVISYMSRTVESQTSTVQSIAT